MRRMLAASLMLAVTAAASVPARAQDIDVARAEANVEALTQQLADLQAALEAEMQAVGEQWDPATDELERVVVKPKRGGVSVRLLGLVWQPS